MKTTKSKNGYRFLAYFFSSAILVFLFFTLAGYSHAITAPNASKFIPRPANPSHTDVNGTYATLRGIMNVRDLSTIYDTPGYASFRYIKCEGTSTTPCWGANFSGTTDVLVDGTFTDSQVFEKTVDGLTDYTAYWFVPCVTAPDSNGGRLTGAENCGAWNATFNPDIYKFITQKLDQNHVTYYYLVRAPASAPYSEKSFVGNEAGCNTDRASTTGYVVSIPCYTTQKIPAPVIDSISPEQGKVGDKVTITGKNFKSDYIQVSAVSIAGTAATTPLTITPTSIVATVPTLSSPNGKIQVVTNGGAIESTDNYVTGDIGTAGSGQGIQAWPSKDATGLRANAILQYKNLTSGTSVSLQLFKDGDTTMLDHFDFNSVVTDSKNVTPFMAVNLTPNTNYIVKFVSTADNKILFSSQPFNSSDNGSAVQPDKYVLLQELPVIGTTVDISNPNNDPNKGVGGYINNIIIIFMGVITVLCVLMLVIGGVQYMTVDSFSGKEGAKSRITNAILGLLLAVSSYAILNTINPHLVNLSVQVQGVSVNIAQDGFSSTITPSAGSSGSGTVIPAGAICNNTGGSGAIAGIVQSYVGKVTYCVGPNPPYATGMSNCGKGEADPQNQGYARYDCSGFVDAISQCAGIKKAAEGSGAGILFSSESVANGFAQHKKDVEKVTSLDSTTANGTPLVPGDIIGWPSVPGHYGHMFIYIGGGTFANSNGNGGVAGPNGTGTGPLGKAVETFSDTTSDYYKAYFDLTKHDTYISRAVNR